MQHSNTIIQGMITMRIIPIIEKIIMDDISVCMIMGFCFVLYLHFNDIIKHYNKYCNKNKFGRIYTLDIYKNRQSCKSSGPKEIKAILYDLFLHKDSYNMNHFETISCAHKSADNWFSGTSVDYDNNFHIPNKEYFSVDFPTSDIDKPMKIYIKKIELSTIDNDDKKKNFDSKTTYTFDIYLLDGDIDIYVSHCNKQYEKYEYDKKNKYPLIECNNSEDDDIVTTRFHSNKRFDDIATNIFIDPVIIDEIKNSISKVITIDPDFERMGQTRKFITLLYGPSGTGKSSIVKAAINYCQRFDNNKVRHIKRVDLSIIKNKDDLYSEFIDSSSKIIYIEEIDRASFIHTNHTDNMALTPFNMDKLKDLSKVELLETIETFCKTGVSTTQTSPSNIKIEDILELLDGLPELDGYIILITTNNVEKIDPRFRRRCNEFYIGRQTDTLLQKQLEFYYDSPDYFNTRDITLPSDKWTGCDVEKKFLKNPTYPTIEDAIKYIQDN